MDPSVISIDATLVGGVGSFVFLAVQNAKRYRWFANHWGLPGAVLLSVLIVGGGLFAAGKVAHGDWLTVYNQLIGAVEAGLAAAAGYRVQRPLGIFEPAPDVDQPGTPYGPRPVSPPLPPTPAAPTPPLTPPVPTPPPGRDVQA